MPTRTAWVKPAPAVTGQDHLGTIAPAESLYATLLPGITNVTARARYYSFYPWFIREFERRFPKAKPDEFVSALRRSECLFALVAVRHARTLDEVESLHGAGMVGREKLVPAVDGLTGDDDIVPLAKHADLDSEGRYFMNPLGGLGQYYFGPLRELGILGGDTRSRDIRYTPERGAPLADAFGAGVDADTFFGCVSLGSVSASQLDSLAAFCPCGLNSNPAERRQLIDLLIDPSATLGEESQLRRSTLALVLDLASRRATEDLPLADEFRASVYTAALFDGSPWMVPAHGGPMRVWSVYAQHELLSIALQGLFWAALSSCELAGRRKFRDAADLAAFALGQLHPAFSPQDWASPFSVFVAKHPCPARSDWKANEHEVQAGWRIIGRDSTPHSVTADAVAILAALLERSGTEDPYANLHFEVGYFDRYGINLRSYLARARGEWSTKPLELVVGSAITWALKTHWRVALQKLADSTPRDTFKVRPLEDDILIVEAPLPMFSVPRIHRVIGLLRDLGALVDDDAGRPSLTKEGVRLREATHG